MAVLISMVALNQNARLSPNRIADAWIARWPRPPRLTAGEKTNNTLSFRAGEYQISYGLMSAPIPWSDLQGPCTNALFWPNAAAEMRRHKGHAIVSVLCEGTDRIEQMKALSKATIALTDSCGGAVGVYWCNAALVFPPQRFAELVCSYLPDELPLPVWINFPVAKNEDGSSVGFTRGLAAFDLKEFETRNSPEPPDELRNRLLGLAEYVIRNGPVIKDGDTVGVDAKERIKVIYDKSSFGGPGKVMRLDYSRQKGFFSSMTTYGRIHAVATLLCTVAGGYFLYGIFPYLRGSIFRHFVLIPLILVCGVILLFVSDSLLQKLFGLESFDDAES